MRDGWYKSTTLWFWILLVLATGLRLFRLGTWDMWTDEMNTLSTSASGEWVSGPMYRTAPLNFLLTRAAVGLLGPGEWGARLVPFLAGLLTVAFVYPAFRRRIGRRAALFSMAVLALSVWHLYWSQTARHFALQTLLLLGALVGFLRYWEDERRLALAAAAALTLAAMFTHSSAGFYLIAFLAFLGGSWLVSRLRRGFRSSWVADDRRHLVALSAFFLLFLAYLPVYVTVGLYTLENRTAWNPPWNILGSISFYVPAYLAVPALAGAAFFWRERNPLGAILLSMTIVPVALVTVASVFTIASGSYCLASMLAIAVLVGVACDRLIGLASDRPQAWARALFSATVLAGLAYDVVLYETYYHGLKPRWKAVCELVGARRAAADLVLADEGDVAQFYLGRERVEWFGRFAESIGRGGFPPAGTRGVWYAVYFTDSPILRKDDVILRHLLERCRLVASFPLHYGPKDRTIALFYESALGSPSEVGTGSAPEP